MNHNNFAIPGLDGDGDSLFGFEAAPSDTLWAGTPNSLAPQVQTVQADEGTFVMPLTKAEVDTILAMRAWNTQSLHGSASLAPPELNPTVSGFEAPSTYGACLSYDCAANPISTNFSDFDMPDDGHTSPNTSDGFGTFELPQFVNPADVFGGLTDCVPKVDNQSDCSAPRSAPIDQPMKRAIDDNANNRAASPIQTEESIRQPEHLEPAQQVLSPSGKCGWPKCTSRAVFKTQASFNMHVRNVHTSPLKCLIANCSHKTPFGRPSDLRRHEQSAHSTVRRFVCTAFSCDAHIKEFAREDHLKKHMKDRHDNYFCPKNHCPRSTKSSFAKPEDIVEHINSEHGLYECAVKACALAPSSSFLMSSLENHMRSHHGMSIDGAVCTCSRARIRLSETVTEADLRRAYYGECKICEKRGSVVKEKA